MKRTIKADRYVQKNMVKVDGTYRHAYHAMPPVGWQNDPNGFGYAFGKYHLFYQFYPYAAHWGPMHWGHYTTRDFVKWELQPMALAPTLSASNGCFSGTSIVAGDKMYLMYTSASARKQTQALAYSADGINFRNCGEVIPASKLPKGVSARDFRDPKVFERNGRFFAIMGSKAADGDGQIIMYTSADLYDWQYVGVVRKDNLTKLGIYECPDFTVIDGTEVLIASPQGYATQDWRYENVHSSIYATGSLNASTGEFAKTYEDEIDGGFDFYAPQTLKAPDGRTIMIAWMQMWERTMPTARHNWAGAMILPRELTLVNGRLYQQPVREIENYRRNKIVRSNVPIGKDTAIDGVFGTKVELQFTLDLGAATKVGVRLYKGRTNETRIYYDRESDRVVFDRSGMGTTISCHPKEKDAAVRSVRVDAKGNKLTMRIFLDVSSCEVFLNGGERVMTGNVYSGPTDNGISFFAEGGEASVAGLEKYDIN